MAESPFFVISPDGSEVSGPLPSITDEGLLQMYEQMLLSRTLDEWCMKLQRMGKVALYAPAFGQEAVQVGATHALEAEDWAFTYYRDTAIYIARGVPITKLLDRFMTTADDPMKGHDVVVFGDRTHRIVPSPLPVAIHIPPAVGFALAAKIRGEKIVILVSFGDGATSKGDFHEGLNLAGVTKAPVVFLCQNNQYAISTPTSRQTATKSLADKAVAYGFSGVRVDGNDPLACYLTVKEAVERARAGGGPTLIEAVTYRLGPHTTADDPKRYRTEAEVGEWTGRDPIVRFKTFLIRRGLWSEEMDRSLLAKLDGLVRNEADRAESKPALRPETILEDVYASEPWFISEERNDFLRSTGATEFTK